MKRYEQKMLVISSCQLAVSVAMFIMQFHTALVR